MRRTIGKILMGAGIVLLLWLTTEPKDDASQREMEIYMLSKITAALAAAACMVWGGKLSKKGDERD